MGFGFLLLRFITVGFTTALTSRRQQKIIGTQIELTNTDEMWNDQRT